MGIAPVTWLMDEPERPAEQVDARGNHRRTDAVLEDQRLDQVVDVAAMVRDIDDPVLCRGTLEAIDVLRMPVDLAKNRVERVLQRAVDGMALTGAQLVEVAVDALLGLLAGGAVASVEIGHHLLARENARVISSATCRGPRSQAPASRAGQTAEVNSEVVELPPRSRVRTTPRPSTRSSARWIASGRRSLAQMTEHQQRRHQQGHGVREVLPRDIRRAAVHRLEHRRYRVPRLAPGTTPSPPTRPAHRSETMSP